MARKVVTVALVVDVDDDSDVSPLLDHIVDHSGGYINSYDILETRDADDDE